MYNQLTTRMAASQVVDIAIILTELTNGQQLSRRQRVGNWTIAIRCVVKSQIPLRYLIRSLSSNLSAIMQLRTR